MLLLIKNTGIPPGGLSDNQFTAAVGICLAVCVFIQCCLCCLDLILANAHLIKKLQHIGMFFLTKPALLKYSVDVFRIALHKLWIFLSNLAFHTIPVCVNNSRQTSDRNAIIVSHST